MTNEEINPPRNWWIPLAILIFLGLMSFFAMRVSAQMIQTGTVDVEDLEIEWFILARYFGNLPKALGPFPSKELCRIAGEDTFPEDQRFWVPERVIKFKADLEQDERERKAKIATMLKTAKRDKNGQVELKLNDCDSVTLDKNDQIIVYGFGCMTSRWIGGSIQSPPIAITGCLTKEGAEKEALNQMKEN